MPQQLNPYSYCQQVVRYMGIFINGHIQLETRTKMNSQRSICIAVSFIEHQFLFGNELKHFVKCANLSDFAFCFLRIKKNSDMTKWVSKPVSDQLAYLLITVLDFRLFKMH